MTVFANPQCKCAARRNKARAATSPAPPAGPVDPAKYPALASETGAELDAAIDWLAHLASGRIEVK